MEPLPMVRTAEPFVVMAKPVGPACNLDCDYCYYLDTARLYEQRHRFRMTDDQLRNYVRQFIEASPGPVVSFVWHGGEPTLAGIDFFRRAAALQRELLPEGWSVWNNLQTNGTTLDDEWAAFLAAERWDVGVSVDGTAWLHDRHRVDHQQRGTYARVVEGVRALQRHGLQPDLLCTVNADIAEQPVAVYRALRDLGTGWMQFIPVVRRGPDGGVTADSVTPEGYGRFLSAVFDEWSLHDVGRLGVQFFAEMGQVWTGGAATVCQMARTCGRVLVVEHDGEVYSCDHFVSPEHRIGNLAADHLGALVDLPQQQRFGLDKWDRLPARCRACRWLDVCNGGCPKDRFLPTGEGDFPLNYLCDGLRAFFAHAEPRLRRAIEQRQQGMTPAAIMEGFRADLAQRWRGVGRNDPCPCGSGRKAKACHWDERP